MSDNVNGTDAQGATPHSETSDTAKQYANEAREKLEEQTAALSERVRESPMTSVLVAAGVGYILGRMSR